MNAPALRDLRPALTDRQIARMVWRTQRFQRFGLTADQAEKLADTLADRDWQRDERRVCLECSEYGRDRSCLPARQGRMPGFSTRFEPVRDVLQRCNNFNWAMPA